MAMLLFLTPGTPAEAGKPGAKQGLIRLGGYVRRGGSVFMYNHGCRDH